ncbi:nucleotidyltransferase family protein [Vreelandella sp. EE22]
MSPEARLAYWLSQDSQRMQALHAAAAIGLSDWCLAAGFVRNLAWDRVHGFESATPLNDIDLIHFDPSDTRPERDQAVEARLRRLLDLPWSVKNQARMHTRNLDAAYCSVEDAMSYWVEVETAVGVALDRHGKLVLKAPFGVAALFDLTITLNPKRPKPRAFAARIASKRWRERWPCLVVKPAPAPPGESLS